MVVPDTLVRHLAPAPEWPLCAHSSCSNNTLHIYESGRDSTGEKSENWFLTLWLCSLVWHSKIKSHSLHCSDFSPEWQPCARTSCSNKILQSYKSCISEGAEIQLSFAIEFYHVAVQPGYFGQYCSLIYLVDKMHIFLRGASAACIFFQGGLSPP